jgi:Neuraminidase (sialidase)
VTADGFPPGFAGVTYNFGDAFVSRSDDAGARWSAGVKVNSDVGAANRIDHYLPGIAISQDGLIAACWYDRRRDPQNFLIDRECATSRDGGQTWKNTLITKRSFSPIIADDLLVNPVYMGDYDGMTSDVLAESPGFLGAYGNNAEGNPYVRDLEALWRIG